MKSKDFVIFLKSKVYVLFNSLMMKNNLTLFQQVDAFEKTKSKGSPEKTNA